VDTIKFSFNGQNYEAGMAFYDKSRAVLPDGTVVQVGGWFETMPPQPQGITGCDLLPFNGTVEEIAERNNAAIARKV
jgi:hypothetical protein